jgi:hypothetical protein
LCLRLKSQKIDVIFWLSKLERMLKSFKKIWMTTKDYLNTFLHILILYFLL